MKNDKFEGRWWNVKTHQLSICVKLNRIVKEGAFADIRESKQITTSKTKRKQKNVKAKLKKISQR